MKNNTHRHLPLPECGVIVTMYTQIIMHVIYTMHVHISLATLHYHYKVNSSQSNKYLYCIIY